MLLTSTLNLRNLTPAEAECLELLPPELRAVQLPRLNPEWCWIVEHHSQPIALVVTSIAHGVLFFWRVLSTASCTRNWLLAALPRILENAREHGCLGYGTFLHDDREIEVRLARILQKSGAVLQPWIGSVAVAPLENYARPGNHGDSGDSLPGSRGGWNDREYH